MFVGDATLAFQNLLLNFDNSYTRSPLQYADSRTSNAFQSLSESPNFEFQMWFKTFFFVFHVEMYTESVVHSGLKIKPKKSHIKTLMRSFPTVDVVLVKSK